MADHVVDVAADPSGRYTTADARPLPRVRGARHGAAAGQRDVVEVRLHEQRTALV